VRRCSGDAGEGHVCDEEEDVCDEGHVLSPVLLVNRTGEGRSRGEGKGGGQCGDEELRAGEALVGNGDGVRAARDDRVRKAGAHDMGGADSGDSGARTRDAPIAAGKAGRGVGETAGEGGGGEAEVVSEVAGKRKSTRKLYAALGKSISELWSDDGEGADEALAERGSSGCVSGRRSTAVGPKAKTTGFFFSVFSQPVCVWTSHCYYYPHRYYYYCCCCCCCCYYTDK